MPLWMLPGATATDADAALAVLDGEVWVIASMPPLLAAYAAMYG